MGAWVPLAGQGASGAAGRPHTYTAEQLRGKTLAQLMEVLKAWSSLYNEGCSCSLLLPIVSSNVLLSAGQGGSGAAARPQTYTAEQLRGKTLAQLMEVLKARGLPVRGKKEELVQRLLEAQDRARRAADPA